jgi:hypothetical protein
MAMHADMVAALRAGWPIVHLVTVTLPDHTIRWTLERGFVKWDGQTYKARDAIYGVLNEISDITDGIDDDASPVQITITPPDLTSLEALASSDAQGGWITIHLACKNPNTGLLVDEPYQLTLGELDQPRLLSGKSRRLEYDIIAGDARGLQPSEEQRQTDAFRQYVWPGERGDEYATDGPKWVYWREDEPRNAIGLLTGRGGAENRAIEFTYEPRAPLCFPMGRCAVSGDIRYRVGYGPTNRYQTVFATCGASGPVQGLVSTAFNDVVTTFDGNDRAIDGEHAGAMWFSFLPGDQPSAALTSPTGPEADGPAPGWTSDHKLSGRPCYAWTGKENSKKSEFNGGIDRPLLVLEGLFGWDPRIEGCEIDDPSTWVWIEEGAIWGLNWCIGRWEGSDGGSPAKYGVPYTTKLVGGIGAPLDLIDVDAFIAAANIADANVWKMAGVPYSDEDKNDVLRDLLAASGAVRSRSGGRISCISLSAATSSVLTATIRDTAAPVSISLAPSRLDRVNTGIPGFYSEDSRWEMTPIAAVSDAAWVAEDGGRNTDSFDYRFVPLPDQAAQLCYLDMAHEREGVEAAPSLKPWMMELEPGNAFEWAAPEYLLDGTKVRVRKRTWSPMDCTAKIDFRQETDAKYTAALAITGAPPPPSTPETPPSPYVEPPTDFMITSAGETNVIDYRNPYPATANHDFVNILRALDSIDPDDASVVDYYAGAPAEFISRPDAPGAAGLYSYWLQAVSIEGDLSELVGPLTGVVAYDAGGNLLADPDDFSGPAWSVANGGGGAADPVVTPGVATAPDGTMTADEIVFVRGSSYSMLRQDVTVVNAEDHDFGVWLRSDTPGASIALRLDGSDGGTLTLTADWQRFVFGATSTSTNMIVQLILFASISGAPATATVEAWSAQLQED